MSCSGEGKQGAEAAMAERQEGGQAGLTGSSTRHSGHAECREESETWMPPLCKVGWPPRMSHASCHLPQRYLLLIWPNSEVKETSFHGNERRMNNGKSQSTTQEMWAKKLPSGHSQTQAANRRRSACTRPPRNHGETLARDVGIQLQGPRSSLSCAHLFETSRYWHWGFLWHIKPEKFLCKGLHVIG